MMYSKFVPVLIVVLFSFSISSAQDASEAYSYYNQAMQAFNNKQHYEAAQYFEKAAEIFAKIPSTAAQDLMVLYKNCGYWYWQTGHPVEGLRNLKKGLQIARQLQQRDNIALFANFIGQVHLVLGQFREAVEIFNELIRLAQGTGADADVAAYRNNLGEAYRGLGEYALALQNYRQALDYFEQRGDEASISVLLNNSGLVLHLQGQYDEALDHFQRALEIDRRQGAHERVAKRLNHIGLVYKEWGRYDEALTHLREALAIEERLAIRDGTILNNIGNTYEAMRQYEKAIPYYENALTVDREQNKASDIARDLNNLGTTYSSLGQPAKAAAFLEEALTIERQLGNEGHIATTMNNLAEVYYYQGQKPRARDLFEESLALERKMDRKAHIATTLNNLGVIAYHAANYQQAIKLFNESVTLKEIVRKTASGDVRRDYLASQVYTYHFLISAHAKTGDAVNAFRACETSRAKLLAERIAGSEDKVSIPDITHVQQMLPERSAILIYANMHFDETVQILISRNNIAVKELPVRDLLADLNEFSQPIAVMLQNQRGMKKKSSPKSDQLAPPVSAQKEDFDDLINYYRQLLVHPTTDNDLNARNIGRRLYNFLIQPWAAALNGKDEILVLPDGILAFLPFETLVDEHNKFLVESYNIKYGQSTGVLQMIRNRKYSGDRRPLLAFGGAVYDPLTYHVPSVTSEEQLEFIENQVLQKMSSRGSLRETYAALDMAGWANLPGTLREVRQISDKVSGSKIITGKTVNEQQVKAMANKGDLAGYRVLHFATHGLVVPELPELSALVLSQQQAESGGEDGYLRMGEIAELNIKADFVNLSACETGLGKIYGGEGVVGLTQSFLIAGANALSVSLWQVADESTAKFMVGLYTLVEKKGLRYDEAITEMKRHFINGTFGEAYRSPYYWAPFVYYGL